MKNLAAGCEFFAAVWRRAWPRRPACSAWGPEPGRERSEPARRRALGGWGDVVAFLPARTNTHPHADKRMGQTPERRRRRRSRDNLEERPPAAMTKARLGRATPAEWSGAQAASDNVRSGWWVALDRECCHYPLLHIIGKRSAVGYREKSQPLACKARWRPPDSLPCGVCCRNAAKRAGLRDIYRREPRRDAAEACTVNRRAQ